MPRRSTIAVCSLLLLLLTLVGCDNTPQISDAQRAQNRQASDHYNKGVKLHNEGKLDEALAEYNQAIAIQPLYLKAYTGDMVFDSGRADIYWQRKQYDLAIADMKFAANSKQDAYGENHVFNRTQAYERLIGLNNIRGDYEAGVEAATSAIGLDSWNISFYKMRGDLYVALGQPDKAVAEYTEALRRDCVEHGDLFNRVTSCRGHIADQVRRKMAVLGFPIPSITVEYNGPAVATGTGPYATSTLEPPLPTATKQP